MANFGVITKKIGKNDPPFNPYVYIVLSEYSSDSGGNIIITQNLINEVEIDEVIDSIIMKLNKARNKAKNNLQKAKENTIAILSQRHG